MRFYRIYFLMALCLFIFSLLLAKVFYYQLVKGELITKQAISMRSKEIALNEYSRGTIYDRNLLALTNNHSVAALYVLPEEIKKAYGKNSIGERELGDFSRQLAKDLTSLNEVKITNSLSLGIKKGQPMIRLASNLTGEEVAIISNSNLPGIVVAPLISRYDDSLICRHVLGYVTDSSEPIGVTGIEKLYNDILNNNRAGWQLTFINDAKGQPIKGLMYKLRNNSNGNSSVVLTIDKRVQEIVEKALVSKMAKGAVVVLDIKSKEILALASRPTYNPNFVSNIINDENSPLINRATNVYYPGSLFKILLAAAALEEDIVSFDDKFYCDGAYQFTDTLAISCLKKDGHGDLSFFSAFANSCNPVFIEVGLKLQREKIMEYVHKFHLTDESIQGWFESEGTKSYVNIKPGPAGIGNACLGQEGVMLTPLNLANLIATIADNGRWGKPLIVKYAINQNGEKSLVKRNEYEQVISKDTAVKVQKLMEEVIGSGTGKRAALSGVQVAGKTATSQTGNYNEDDEEWLNTWFGGYLPADNPKWAIVVMVEKGTSGSVNAAPIFREISEGLLNLFSVLE
ncbi:MAG: hypothetical protein GX333_05375 [Syntrophomonadaceae bacterium]|nr:hypothetical protein [Syntrophomonadaceae bacterium]